jgi:DNA mismatch repair protein MutS
MKIDAQSLRELEVLGTVDDRISLFERLKATTTAGGDRRLQERFRSPLGSVNEIRRTQQAIQFLGDHSERFKHLLNGSNWLTIEHYIATGHSVLGHPRPWMARWDALRIRIQHGSVFEQIRLGLATVQTAIRYVRTLLDDLAGVEAPELIRELLDALERAVTQALLLNLARPKNLHDWRTSSVFALDWTLREAEFRPIRALAKLIYELDALRSLAVATRRFGFVVPQIREAPRPEIRIEGLHHPFLRQPVANDVAIDPKLRLLFITGPNMAGKSTYLKSAALAVYMAHLGMGVPAEHAELSVFDRLFTGIDTNDAIAFGESYYFREVRRVREIAGHLAAGERAFVFFDEMFRGTNLKDAAEGTACVVRGFLNFETSAFVVSSHIAEVAEGLQTIDGVELLHFRGDVEESGVRFDYRLRKGISEQRLGMYFLRQQGVLASLGVEGPPSQTTPAA